MAWWMKWKWKWKSKCRIGAGVMLTETQRFARGSRTAVGSENADDICSASHNYLYTEKETRSGCADGEEQQ
jgi:hypothetical protein